MVSMEIHRSKVAAKKLWNQIRLALILVKKGLISKRKLIVELNLAFKKIRQINRFFIPSSSISRYHQRDYEFSCSDSPSPIFSRVRKNRAHHHLFPCIRSPLVLDEESSLVHEDDQTDSSDRGYSSEEEVEGGDPKVDDEAEEFIKRFYEQLRSQNRAQLLQFH